MALKRGGIHQARPAGACTSALEELPTMLQNLLTERFKLQIHPGTGEVPVCALVVDKGEQSFRYPKAQNFGGRLPADAAESRPGQELITG